MGALIAAVDDDQTTLNLVALALRREGFGVKTFLNGSELLSYLSASGPAVDLVLLDIIMPPPDGYEVCRALRANPRTAKLPIIFLSAQDEPIDKALGLELGADDFVSKPFHPKELAARVRAVLRRLRPVEPAILSVGDLSLDLERFEATYQGTPVPLTRAEFKLLSILSRHPGTVFTRSQLIDGIWDGNRIVTDRSVDVHIRRLRKKLGKGAAIIRTVRGIGYKIQA